MVSIDDIFRKLSLIQERTLREPEYLMVCEETRLLLENEYTNLSILTTQQYDEIYESGEVKDINLSSFLGLKIITADIPRYEFEILESIKVDN